MINNMDAYRAENVCTTIQSQNCFPEVNVMSPLFIEKIRSEWMKAFVNNLSHLLVVEDSISLMRRMCKKLVRGVFNSIRSRVRNRSGRFVLGLGRQEVLNNLRKCLPLNLSRLTHIERFDGLLEWVATQTTIIINSKSLIINADSWIFWLHLKVPWRILRHTVGIWNSLQFGDHRPKEISRTAGDGRLIIALPTHAPFFAYGDAKSF